MKFIKIYFYYREGLGAKLVYFPLNAIIESVHIAELRIGIKSIFGSTNVTFSAVVWDFGMGKSSLLTT